ncbi:Fpg/Nei family DNA glycosylase [Oerskovia flava]|uniref:Fpg/Nei family DNA glycosylase n=1 Tax=Oerskovia flava TaxID=2986422 RepID=UPI00223F48C2|nr:zinc finger domain-containing protein [Oerskovia sp. JB1-3-2]
MPEGHTVHRLARTFGDLFGSRTLQVTSPQGRFAAGAALIDGRVLVDSQAYGKQLFLGLADGTRPSDVLWLRVHLGLYGAWTFDGDGSTAVVHAIGAPRRRVGERETAPAGPAGAVHADGSWTAPAPRGAVRVRLLAEHAVADLTGPTACEVVTAAEKDAVVARLGPDPIRDDHTGDPGAEVAARVRRSRTTVGQLLMQQEVLAGVGNIYRAEVLFRAGLDPLRPGRDVPAEVLRKVWDDLVVLMRDGAATGAIVTTRPQDRGASGTPGASAPADPRRRVRQNTDDRPGAVDADDAFYVYHRDGRPCRVCGTPVLVKELGGRSLYWCGVCQV